MQKEVKEEQIVHYTICDLPGCGKRYRNPNYGGYASCSACKNHFCTEHLTEVSFEPFSYECYSDYPNRLCPSCLKVFNECKEVKEARKAKEQYIDIVDRCKADFLTKCKEANENKG